MPIIVVIVLKAKYLKNLVFVQVFSLVLFFCIFLRGIFRTNIIYRRVHICKHIIQSTIIYSTKQQS